MELEPQVELRRQRTRVTPETWRPEAKLQAHRTKVEGVTEDQGEARGKEEPKRGRGMEDKVQPGEWKTMAETGR